MSLNTKITRNSLKYYEKDHNYATVLIVPMFQDNYGYIIIDKSSGLSAVVDPGESEPIVNVLEDNQINLNQIWCTHKHNDHVGGNAALKERYKNLKVLGTKYEHIPMIDEPLSEGSTFKLGLLDVTVWHLPCHTKGHIAFIVRSSNGDSPAILFSGDTLFVGGCGRFFEGNANDMLNNMIRLSTLPESTYVYCAHEYTESNYRFLSHIDAKTCSERYNDIVKTRKEGNITVPSTIANEKSTNLFLRCEDINLQTKVKTKGSAVETMKILRERKNNFK